MGPTHNNQNGLGGPKKGGLVKITTPVFECHYWLAKHKHQKKVLLRERKRHTDRGVSSTPSAVLPGRGGGSPVDRQTDGLTRVKT